MPEAFLDIAFRLFVIGLLVFANGFFVASEFALVSVRKTRIYQLSREGNKTAKVILTELEDIDKFIAAVQLGITIASLGLGWVGESTLADIFYPLFNFIPDIGRLITTHALAAGTAFILITILHVVLGELLPKSLALQYPEKISFIIAKPMYYIGLVFYPFVYILNGLGNGILRLFKAPPASGAHLVHSEEELDMLITDSYKEGVLNETERNLLHNVFKFSDLIARQVMIPRTDMLSVSTDMAFEELVQFANEHQFTRYPVYEQDLDHIVGLVHIKDILAYTGSKEEFNVKNIIRKAIFVPETLTMDKLLLEFKKQKSQMAIIFDEFGGTSGIITLEDVLEEIFGNVQDEFDIEEPDIRKISEDEYVVNAMLRIDEINEMLGLNMEEEEIETIGGLILKELGRIPNIQDKVKIKNYTFNVENVEGTRITKLKITRNK